MKSFIYFLIIAISLTLTSCKQDNTMDSLNLLLEDVNTSQTAEQEKKAFLEIADYMEKYSLSINVSTLVGETEQPLQDIENLEKVNKARVVFSSKEEEKLFIWEPKDINNIFILYRE